MRRIRAKVDFCSVFRWSRAQSCLLVLCAGGDLRGNGVALLEAMVRVVRMGVLLGARSRHLAAKGALQGLGSVGGFRTADGWETYG